MGKNHRHQKNLKFEKAKVKLKTKKGKTLPKGQNITDTSFKVKKIIVREQLKSHERDEIVSRRKLNVKELLSRLQHHNSTVRQAAIQELKEILQSYPPELLSAHLSILLQGISSLALDKERDIRKDTLKALSLLLGPLSTYQLAPFAEILVSYLCCTMTHINPSIKEDSLNFLDVLIHSCPSLLSKNTHKILPNFLDMISTHSHTSIPRQLTTTLNSRNTTIKWRIKVLQRLSSIFISIINDLKSRKNEGIKSEARRIFVDDKTTFLNCSHENNLAIWHISDDDRVVGYGGLRDEDFKCYVKSLMPLMMESWIEVRPKDVDGKQGSLWSQEAAEMLGVVVRILINLLDILEMFEGEEISGWFRVEVLEGVGKFLMGGFPYGLIKSVNQKGRKGRIKRQDDFGEGESDGNGLIEENLGLGLIFVGLSCREVGLGKREKEELERVVQYVCDQLNNWKCNEAAASSALCKFLRVLFLKASKNLYRNGISLVNILRRTISAACRQPKRELQSQLFAILGEIVLDHRLNELQR
ncbi:testis-expressed sequence 10 protein homolog isoform X2 [Fopius arisanus]|uniref:Testis-expressed sequence 10 protein homolog isoform X2 n=1 Tax=Fopius arisanus TaxID=64838 RepID=A0A0C9QEE7_9HYME|nr:PREDICTED: testis-expressed sequence 10 protein homolog isoform X2 [Fopius arisanus]